MASDYDYLSASNGNGDAPLMHITGNRLVGSTVIPVDTVLNVPSKFIGTYGDIGTDGLITPASKRDFKGHISSGSLIIDAFEPGSTDSGNTAGQIVIIKPNTGWANRIAQFIKNATGFGTPENLFAAALNAVTGVFSGNVTSSGVVSGRNVVMTVADTMDGISGATRTTSATSYEPFNSPNSITVNIGASGKAWIDFGATSFTPTGAGVFTRVSFSASGANTIAAGTYEAAPKSSAANSEEVHYRRVLLKGLTPGPTTFQLQCCVSGGSGQFTAGDLNAWAV